MMVLVVIIVVVMMTVAVMPAVLVSATAVGVDDRSIRCVRIGRIRRIAGFHFVSAITHRRRLGRARDHHQERAEHTNSRQHVASHPNLVIIVTRVVNEETAAHGR